MDQDIKIEAFCEKCREFKLKITPQRLMIYRELSSSDNHPSADVIYRKVKKYSPGISFDTVNRTLLTFSKLGIVKMVEGYGNPRRFDANPLDHHHFRCIECMGIIDVYNRSFDDLEIPGDIKKRHLVLGKKVVLEGVCHECRKSGQEEKIPSEVKND
jgi:Fur family peroxide stress response transcriptional regulator